MRYIDLSLIKTDDPEVDKWLKRALALTEKLKSLKTHKERAEFFKNHPIWSDFKDILISYFGEKCWYSDYSIENSLGDVDHFRPKNCSTDEKGNIILKDGYWWLAYDYINYRLSCERCNRPNDDTGKKDIFPLKNGTTPATYPNRNDVPILLDPCNEDDVLLIYCDEEGKILPLTSDNDQKLRVEITIKIYNLSRFDNTRRIHINQCKGQLSILNLFYKTNNEEGVQEALKQIEILTDDKSNFSSFVRKYIKNEMDNYECVNKIRDKFAWAR